MPRPTGAALPLALGAIFAVAPVLRAAEPPARYLPAPLLRVQDAYPHVSRDGLVVFQSDRLGVTKLFVAGFEGAGLRQLTQGASADVTPKWSFDGKQVAYASQGSDGDEDIWIVNADGSGARNLTNHPGSDSHPSWSPDGRRIVFCSTRGDGENDDIYVVNVDGSGLRRLTDNGPDWDTFPSFSPDGRKILFRRLMRQRAGGVTLWNSEIMVMSAEGGEAANLSRDAYFDGWPAWSPDGTRIAFSSNRSDTYHVYVMNADGSGTIEVTDGPFTDVRPQWLPDGTGLVFNREHDGRSELMQVRVPDAR